MASQIAARMSMTFNPDAILTEFDEKLPENSPPSSVGKSLINNQKTNEQQTTRKKSISCVSSEYIDELATDCMYLIIKTNKLKSLVDKTKSSQQFYSESAWKKVKDLKFQLVSKYDRLKKKLSVTQQRLKFVHDTSSVQHHSTSNQDNKSKEEEDFMSRRLRLEKIETQLRDNEHSFKLIIKRCDQEEDRINREEIAKKRRETREMEEEDTYIPPIEEVVNKNTKVNKSRQLTFIEIMRGEGASSSSEEEEVSFLDFLNDGSSTPKKKKTKEPKIKNNKQKNEPITAITNTSVNRLSLSADQMQSMLDEVHKKRQQEAQEKKKREQEREEENIQQVLKLVLSSADANTLETEKKIAEETLSEFRELESEFDEVHSMMVDLNMMIKEQGQGINIILHNVEEANKAVLDGIQNIKDASSYTAVGGIQSLVKKVNVASKIASFM
ncbi:syntaxin-7 [Acrasis kona]|uniref:Syntaxin-7 n=1 Tax=Acrasis kona TaxID=1008807 RepID=A0AAW2ZPZ6_9EUKA